MGAHGELAGEGKEGKGEEGQGVPEGRHGELLGRWGLIPAALVRSLLLLLLSVTCCT
jgi:hypothetical protein